MKINKTKVIAYAGMIALLASMIVGLLGFSSSTRDINNVKNQLLRNQIIKNIKLKMQYVENTYGRLTQGDETLLDANGESIEGRFGVVDSILKDLGDKSTIFVKVNDDFKRISTNITYEDKERALGTFLGTDHKAYETVMNGGLYVGDVEILGESYYGAYDPVRDKNGNVIGLLFVGTPTKELDNIINMHEEKMNKIDISIIILRTISLGSLIALVAISVMGTNFNSEDKNSSDEALNKSE